MPSGVEKLKLEGESETAAGAGVPVPLRITVWGLPLALSEIVKAPLILPVAVGAKLTLIVQLAPPAREDPQLSVSENCWLAVMPTIESAKAPELVTVIG